MEGGGVLICNVAVKLATDLLKYTIDFDAYELWLMRIAMLHCVKTNGVKFIIQHGN